MKNAMADYFRFDWTLLLSALVLTVIGLLAIYGIGFSRDSADFFQFKKQLVAAVIGLGFVLAAVFVDYRQLRSLYLPLYFAGFLLLLSVLFFGQTIRGMRGWFVLGNLSFQPVEISKVLLAVFLAGYLSRFVHKRLSWAAFVGSGFAVGLYVAPVLFQPDFGSAMVMIVMWLAAVLFAGLPRRAWLIMLVGVTVVISLTWSFGLQSYQRGRIISFINPTLDPRGAGYNVRQARIAIGSGGWFGKGIGEGSQSRLRFLPEASTDFVFSVLGEELGFFGILIVLGLFALLLFRFVYTAATIDDPFPQILVITLASYLAFHILVNAGMNLGIMPVTGIPLPFVSAAPSSLSAVFFSVALVECVALRSKPAAFR